MPPYILRRDRDRNDKAIRAVRPNVGIELGYRRKLYDLIESMHASVMYWIEAAYKAHGPVLAMDAIWNESDHPRVGGGEHGGEFTSGGGGGGSSGGSAPSPQVKAAIKTATKGSGLVSAKLSGSDRDLIKSWAKIQPKSSKPTYRGLWMSSKDWTEKHQELDAGQPMDVSALSSSTSDPIRSAAYGTGGDHFIQIEFPPDTTVNISDLSVYPQEEEHILPDDAKFVIESRERTAPGFWKIKLKKVSFIAQDASPAHELQDAIRKLVRQWLHNFDEAADDLADYFAKDVSERSDAALMAALRKGGFAVKFTMTKGMRDIIAATVNQNVGLIKSIPQQYLGQVEGMVMRSVQTGRDMGQLAKDLQTQLGVTKRRAALISRDQNNKATSAMQRARQIEMNITEAIWMHSHAGKTPRPSHVKMNGKRYDVTQGMWDEDENKYVYPGELINCRCVSRSVIPGLEA